MPKKLAVSLAVGSIATLLAPVALVMTSRGRLDVAWVIIGWQVVLNLIAIPLLLQWRKENIQ